MSDYIMSPGADLYIGPGGKPYESLGHHDHGKRVGKSCCSDCASGKKKCGDGALGQTPGKTGISFVAQVPFTPSSSSTPGTVASSLPSWAPFAVAGVGVVGLLVYLRKRSKKNPSRRRRRR